MEPFKISANLFLDTRRSKSEDRYPVKLRVYFDAESRSYKTGIDLSKDEWEKLQTIKNLRDDNLRIIKRKLNSYLEKANRIIDSQETFSFDAFKNEYYYARKVRKTSILKDLFDEYISNLESNDQIGTAISYQTTINSIERFKPRVKLIITDVTAEFLKQYERWLMDQGLSPSTAGIYLRQLRRIVNISIKKGLLSRDKYPFESYSMPTARNIKKALSLEQIKSLLQYQTTDPNVRKALDFWIFSYLSNGMNMADICLLKPEYFHGEFFFFYRVKTKNTKKRDLRPIKVPLVDRTREIIEYYRSTHPDNPYLFPILEAGLTAKQIKYRIQDFIYFINKNMKEVAKSIGVDKLGTYVARHTHSTILKRKGVPTEFIKENLGHSSVLITENYLDDFSDEAKQEYSKLLWDL